MAHSPNIPAWLADLLGVTTGADLVGVVCLGVAMLAAGITSVLIYRDV